MTRRSAFLRRSSCCTTRSIALVSALLLSACATSEPRLAPACPDVGLINGLHETTIKDDRDAPLLQAEMVFISGGCNYTEDGIELGLEISIVAEYLQDSASKPVELVYFVAVLNDLGGIVGSESFEIEIGPAPQGSQVVLSENLSQFVLERDWTRGANYQGLIGFDIDPSEARERWLQTTPFGQRGD